MKAALKKLPFVIFLLSPTIVVASGCGDYTSDGQQICETYYTCKWEDNACIERCPSNNDGTCVNYNGCYNDEYECQPCDQNYYNNDSTGIITACSLCATQNNAGTSWIWYNDIDPIAAGLPYNNQNHISAGVVFDADTMHYGQSSCPWKCQSGYFDAHTECFYCPTSTSGFMSYRASADISHISTCNSCGSDRYIIKKTVIENGEQGYKYYCGTCDLNVTPTETGNGTNVYTCTCPENTNHNSGSFTTNSTYHECVCPNNATWNGTQCVCNDPDETIVLDTITNLYVCSSCSDSHAVLDNGVCKCDIGYYGTTNGLHTSCSKCPTGTITTAIGATYRTDCQMNSSTKFCYGSGNNKTCISLLPSGVTINASTTAPNNANNVAQNIAQ